MKLKCLTIHNIASIKDAVIDFSVHPLSDSGVFLISGITGSGKSTILDAISLALFNMTPRLNSCLMEGKSEEGNLRVKDTRELLRRGTGEGSVTLTFTGNDDRDYEVVWQVRRARNKPSGALQKVERILTDIKEGHSFAGKRDIEAQLRECIGLDFEQFCRTTMLAQGDFAKFLNSKDEDKSAILEKITGVGIYSEIGRRIFERAREKRMAVEELLRLLDAKSPLPEEELQAMEERVKTILLQIKEKDVELSELTKIIDWFNQDTLLIKDEKAGKQALDEARDVINSEEYTAMVSDIRDFPLIATLRSLLQQKKTTASELSKTQKNIESYKSELSGYLYEYQAACATLGKHRKELSDAMSPGGLAEKYFQFLVFARENYPAKTWPARLFLTDAAEEESLLNELSAIVGEMNVGPLVKKQQHQAQILNHLSALQRADNDCKEAAKQLTEKEQEEKEQADNLNQLRVKLVELGKALHDADVKADTLAEVYEKQKASVEKWASDLRAKLIPGDTCPVCRSLITKEFEPEEDYSEAVAGMLNTLNEARKVQKNRKDKYDKCEAQIRADEKALKRMSKDVEGAKRKCKSLAKELETLERQPLTSECIAGNVDSNKRDYQQLIASASEESRRLAIDIEQLTELTTLLNELSSDFIKRRKKCHKLKEKIESLQTDIQNLKSELDEIVTSSPDWDTIEPEKSSKKLEMKDLSALRNKVVIALSARDNLGKQLEEINENIAAERSRLSEVPKERLECLLELTENVIEGYRKNILKAKERVAAAEELVKSATAKLVEHQKNKPTLSDADTIESISARKAEVESARASLLTERGALEERLKLQKQLREEIAELAIQLLSARKEHDKWQALSDVFGDAAGIKFRKIAQSYILRNLVDRANIYMATLTERYRLSLTPGTFIINVIDAFMGDSIRPTSLISGGETFLVSLALALALADIGEGKIVDTLFIDEGFGSLSGEPLRKAIDTLRLLNDKNGRTVGIISHIDELRDRIPVQLRVEQLPGTSFSSVTLIS